MAILWVLFLTVFIMAFGYGLLLLASKLGPKLPHDAVKLSPYECGLPGIQKKDSKVPVKFYLTAVLFIIFDIEIIFMYPWAITFRDAIGNGEGLYYLGVMGLFLAVFIIGLVWEIRSRALEWE